MLYLHLGANTSVPVNEIIVIADVDECTKQSNNSNTELLKRYEDNGDLVRIGDDLPQSMIISKDKAYFSPMTVSVLRERYIRLKKSLEDHKFEF